MNGSVDSGDEFGFIGDDVFADMKEQLNGIGNRVFIHGLLIHSLNGVHALVTAIPEHTQEPGMLL